MESLGDVLDKILHARQTGKFESICLWVQYSTLHTGGWWAVRCNVLTGRESAVVSAKGEKRSQFAFQVGKKPLSDAQQQPEFPQIKGDNMQGDDYLHIAPRGKLHDIARRRSKIRIYHFAIRLTNRYDIIFHAVPSRLGNE